jgi:endonuclease/exonuclease/phosphatase family metal-dependent hydrolase
MRLATFNLENMFERPAIMNLPSNDEGRQVLADYYHLSDLIQKELYSQEDKDTIFAIMKQYSGLLTATGDSTYIRLIESRGHLTDSKHTKVQANGRGDWIGWFELKRDAVDEIATENTARVIDTVNADILCMVEVEDRIAVNRFDSSVIPKINGQKYSHTMVIDGNDDRGIDVGIMTKQTFDIKSIGTHVDDSDENGPIFSRDCAEYTVGTPSGSRLLLLVNHFKSQGYGNPEDNDAKRKRQAKRVREIYEERLGQGIELIAIVGDLNDSPERDPLQPLVSNGSTLVDIMKDPHFSGDSRPGTYGDGIAKDKFDYILMSPKLLAKVRQGGIERRGVWGGKNGTLFPHFPEITSKVQAASDHAALWVDLDL